MSKNQSEISGFGRLDLSTSEHANALAEFGVCASGGYAPSSGTRIEHVGSPDYASLDLRALHLDEVISTSAEHAEDWKERNKDDAWSNHRFVVTLPDSSAATTKLAQVVRGAESVGSVFVQDNSYSSEPAWQWPLKVGWIRGSAGAAVVELLVDQSAPYWMHTLVEYFEWGAPNCPGLVDFLFVSEHADPHPLLSSRGMRANALVLADGDSPGIDRLDQARGLAEHLGASSILVPAVGGATEVADWFSRLIEEVTHKNPLDVAMGKSTEIGFVVGNDSAMQAPLENVMFRMAGRVYDIIGGPLATAPDPSPGNSFGVGGEPDLAVTGPGADMPASLRILEPSEDRDSFSMEGSGATQIRELREANELGIDLLPDTGAKRLLQAAVFRNGDEVEHAFANGHEHDVHIWIGNGATGFLHAQTPSGTPALIDHTDLSPDIPADIVVWGDDVEMQVAHVVIHPSLLSELASFHFNVPKSAKEFTLNVALLVQGRVIQSGVIKGPATPSGGRPRRANAPEMRFVVGADLVDLSAIEVNFGDETVTIMEHDAGAHGMFKSKLHTLDINDLSDHFERSLAALVEAQIDSKKPTWLSSAAGAKAFTKLAWQGADAFQSLVGSWALAESDRLAAMIESDSVHVAMFSIDRSQLAVELLYDRFPPQADVGWCDDFDEALETGRCPSCAAWSPAGRPPANTPVCPAGFWGIRKIIERTTVPADEQGFPIVLQNRTRSTQEPIDGLDRVLIGTSDRVDKVKIDGRIPTEVMLESIEACLGAKPPVVTDWAAWQEGLPGRAPQVLVLLTHTESNALQLGSGTALDQRNIYTDFVREPYSPSPAGPVVLLLGCDTATTNSSLTSFAATFMQRGASVVVGTLGSTLGRFAAPIAGELVAAIADPYGPPTIGEAVLQVRRSTLAKGWVTGMLVSSYGAADYTFER